MGEKSVSRGKSPVEEVEIQGNAGFASCTTNLLKSIMGAGMLTLPSALNSVGAIPGLLLLFIAALLSGVGLQLLVLASDRITKLGLGPHRQSNFKMLAGPTYPKASFIFELAVLIKCSLVAASYLTVAGDVLPSFIKAVSPNAWPFIQGRLFWVCLTATIISPVCYLNRMDSLKFTSFLGLLGVFYLFILAIVLFFGYNPTVAVSFNNIRLFVPFTFSSLTSFSYFVFALTCHQNIFPIYNEIKDNRPSRLLSLISICMIASFAIYALFALSFYGVFGQAVKTNVLNNLPRKGWPYSIAQLLYGTLMIFSFPLQIFPARNSFVNLLSGVTSGSPRILFALHAVLTTVLLVFTWLVAALKAPLGILLSLVGCTAGPVICYFLPALFWWKLEQEGPLRGWKIGSLSLFIFGTLATVIPLTALIISFFK